VKAITIGIRTLSDYSVWLKDCQQWVHVANLYRVYNCDDSRAYGYKWSGILTELVGNGLGTGLVMDGNKSW
jgi:hypothetical protein